MNTPIHDFLVSYAESGAVRCHMPGGKGLIFPHDITEIAGADVLYESSGIILESEQNAAALFGAEKTCYSCGGSTLAIQAMLCAALSGSTKKTVLAGRYCHKSLVNTAVLLGFNIDWLYPDRFLGTDISPESVEKGITDDTAAVFVNSIDYYGGEADIPAIAAVCRKHGIPLLADNAHGAYRVFTGNHPITQGAAMTADSAHKTLPAITGTAYLHTADVRYYEAAKSAMSVFGSSSPSYLMLESLDLCNKFIAEQRAAADTALSAVSSLKERLSALGIPLRKSDAMRITIDAAASGYSGGELSELLRSHGIECEMSDAGYVVLLFSVVQNLSDYERICSFFRNFRPRAALKLTEPAVFASEMKLSPREAFFAPSEKLPVSRAAGRICAEVCCPCPPCVPLAVPGEVITDNVINLLCAFGIEYIRAI